MGIMMRLIVSAAALFIILSTSFCQNGAPELQEMGIGARSLAMGGAGTAIIGLPFASFYNPASVSARGNFSLSGGNQFLDLGRRLYFASLASEISGGAGVGITWVHSSVSDVEARDIDGQLQGTVSNGDDAIFFAFAKALVPKVHLGIGVEYLQREVANVVTSTAGFGTGISYRPGKIPLTIGAAVQNIFMTLSWNSNEYYGRGQVSNEKVPMLFRLGAFYSRDILGLPFNFCGDLWRFEGSDEKINYAIGLEAQVAGKARRTGESESQTYAEDESANRWEMPSLILRLGFTDNGPSAGAGIYTKVGRSVFIGIDYAITTERENLAPRHLIDITVEH